jgi:hypothetical protein
VLSVEFIVKQVLRKSIVFVFGLLVLGGVSLYIWASMQNASHQGDWLAVHNVMPQIEFQQDRVAISSLRNFRYDSDQRPRQIRYFQDTFPLAGANRLWFGLSHFADWGMAHNLVSFEFDDGRFLTLSVEARMEQGQEYDPLLGLFNQFEMIYILGAEADIIGLRSHVRREQVFLYPMTLPREQVQSLLVTFLRDAQTLQDNPRFYNTVFSNCLSHLLLLSGAFSKWDIVTDWRLLAPGYSDQVAQSLGYIDSSVPLSQLKATVKIAPDIAPEDPQFSAKIRGDCADC